LILLWKTVNLRRCAGRGSGSFSETFHVLYTKPGQIVARVALTSQAANRVSPAGLTNGHCPGWPEPAWRAPFYCAELRVKAKARRYLRGSRATPKEYFMPLGKSDSASQGPQIRLVDKVLAKAWHRSAPSARTLSGGHLSRAQRLREKYGDQGAQSLD